MVWRQIPDNPWDTEVGAMLASRCWWVSKEGVFREPIFLLVLLVEVIGRGVKPLAQPQEKPVTQDTSAFSEPCPVRGEGRNFGRSHI